MDSIKREPQRFARSSHPLRGLRYSAVRRRKRQHLTKPNNWEATRFGCIGRAATAGPGRLADWVEPR